MTSLLLYLLGAYMQYTAGMVNTTQIHKDTIPLWLAILCSLLWPVLQVGLIPAKVITRYLDR